MRVLFTMYPDSRAHLYPVVPLAWALQSAGHEVRLATHHSSIDIIKRTGLTPVPLGRPEDGPVRPSADCNPPMHQDVVLTYAEVMGLSKEDVETWIVFFQVLLAPISDYVRVDRGEASDLIDFAKTWKPDLVLWDPTHPAGAVAAQLSGAAHARLLIGQDQFGWSVDRLTENAAALRAAGLDENPLATVLGPLAEKYGLEVTRELMLGQWTVDTQLADFRLPTTTRKLAMRHVPYADPEVLPDWMHVRPEEHGGPRRVAMSLGESTRRFVPGDWDRTPKILQACEGLDDIEIVATLDQMQLTDVDQVPPNVRAIDWVPLPALMQTSSTLIHHGGYGTYASAVAFQVPQLVCDLEGVSVLMRLVEDEPEPQLRTGTLHTSYESGVREEIAATSTHWELPAKKIEATPVSDFIIAKGAGGRLDHRAQTVEEIRELIRHTAYDTSYHNAAADLRNEWLAMPSPGEIIPDLEKLVAQHRRL
jgi:glycosyltransferase